jgi:hypothetical protein
MTTSLELAGWLAQHGFHVFPLRPHSKRPFGNCARCKSDLCIPAECGCLTAERPCHGYLSATSDTEQVGWWWSRTPRANIGISTGHSGLAVLDLDCKPKPAQSAAADVAARVTTGLEALQAILAAEEATWPETLTIATPSGGRHLYFRAPADQDVGSDASGKVGHQVDVRAQGGYVVAPGCEVTAPPEDAFGSYTRVSRTIDITPLPDWLHRRLIPTQPTVELPKAPNLRAVRPGDHTAGYWHRIWAAELHKVETQDGERWRILYSSARRLANLATHDTAPWSENDAVEALVAAGLRRRERTGKQLEPAAARRNVLRGWQRGTQDGPESLGFGRTA